MSYSSPDPLADRHPATRQVVRHFAFDHLPPHLRAVSEPCAELASRLVRELPDGPELTAGLRKLLEVADAPVLVSEGWTKVARTIAELAGGQPQVQPWIVHRAGVLTPTGSQPCTDCGIDLAPLAPGRLGWQAGVRIAKRGRCSTGRELDADEQPCHVAGPR